MIGYPILLVSLALLWAVLEGIHQAFPSILQRMRDNDSQTKTRIKL